MIPNSSTKNMGSIVSLSVLKIEHITSFRSLNNRCQVIISEGIQPTTVYFSHKSLRVATEPNGPIYGINISWRTPNDRHELFDSIKPFINQKVIIFATLSSGIQKVYGSKGCPLVLSYLPTEIGSPTDWNGVNIFASGKDFSSGRYIPLAIAPPPPDIHIFNEWDSELYQKNSSYKENSGSFGIEDFEKCNASIDSSRLVLQITQHLSYSSRIEFRCLESRSFDLNKITIDFHSITENLVYTKLWFWMNRDSEELDAARFDITPSSAGINVFDLPSNFQHPSYWWGFSLERDTVSGTPQVDEPSVFRINSIEFN